MLIRFISGFLTALLFFYNPIARTAETSLNLYDTFEKSIGNNNSYSNPFDFSEITLHVETTSPSGKNYRFSGFYDGEDSQHGPHWKFRFMPDEAGEWNYRYSWSDDSPAASGTFNVTADAKAGNHGHIRVDPNHPRYLSYDDGEPHYWWGGKWISALDYGPVEKNGEKNHFFRKKLGTNTGHKTDQQLLDYLDLMQRYRHNGLLLKIALFPLENDRISWDLDWIQRGEWLVREAAKRDIYVQINLFDTWSRNQDFWFQNSTAGDQQVFNVWESGFLWFNDDQVKRNYLQTVIARFAGFANVYWELGNEMEHTPNCGSCFVKLANKHYIPWIREFDPYDLPIGLSEGIWQDADVDIGFLHQTNKLPEARWQRPVVMNELVRGGIEEALWRDAAMRDSVNRIAFRRTFWRMFTYGGSGSSQATWLDLEQPMNQAVFDVMADQQRLRDFIEALPVNVNQMDTDDETIISGPGEFRSRSKAGEVYVSYFLLEPGQSSDSGQVQLRLPAGAYTGRWYDPKTGNYSDTISLTADTAQQTLDHPDFAEDIVLLIIKQK